MIMKVRKRFESCEDEIRENMKEWSIAYDDLRLVEKIQNCRSYDIHRGQWHGEVLIYTFHDDHRNERINEFWDEIAQLSLIRHENIMLFMGACVEPPKFAVITSMRKGPLLHEIIHCKERRVLLPNKISIMHQIAQGMGYLHAKGIIHKRLNSSNIIVESKVKICLMDQGYYSSNESKNGYACVPRGHLTYISPELMKTVKIEPPHIHFEQSHSQESDIYSFGTLLYEVLHNEFPYHQLINREPHLVIWLISHGHHERTDHLNVDKSLKTLITRCWTGEPEKRPKFKEIVNKLQWNIHNLHVNIPLLQRHSCSEPERLNTIGLHVNFRGFCS